MSKTVVIGVAAIFLAFVWACDSDIYGERLDNLPPETELAVRDTSLVDNLGDDDRLTSTVLVSWSGIDADGFVVSFEVRSYPPTVVPSATDGWAITTSKDSVLLLPIPLGQKVADVVVEVRAIDNDGSKDPSPARTVFPIQNSPPELRLSNFDSPPDTTFSVVSFAWTATDPDGLDNLARIEVALNDSTSLVGLDPTVDFITVVGDIDPNDSGQTSVEARVFLGKAFRSSTIRLPGLRLGGENTFYARAVDLTDTTSVVEQVSWYVKRQVSDILLVNDFRKPASPTVLSFHAQILTSYLPPGSQTDTWDLSLPHVTGQGGNAPRSGALPSNAEPTLRQTLSLFRFIYWVSSNTTNSTVQNNLPFAANVMDLFFEQGGKLMVHSPVNLPGDPSESLSNPAVLLLPLSDLITFPDTLRPTLRMATGSEVSPLQPIPGVGEAMPALRSKQFIIGTLPFVAESGSTVPLFSGEFTYITRDGRRQGTWGGASTVASMSADRRIGLFSLPLVNEQNGAQTLEGVDGEPDDPQRAIHLMLKSLGFPGR